MNQQDFDVQGLARYLHLGPQQIEKLVSRGHLPGRKVAASWRFSRAEIHHWLEERLGIYEEADLARVESAMEQQAPEGAPEVRMTELIRTEVISVPLQARTRDSVVRAMMVPASEIGLLWDPVKMAEAVRAREELMTTAMDNGVAILHPRRPQMAILAEPFVGLGITPQGIPFGGSRGLTDVFFLVASVDDREHLQTLARLSRLLQKEAFLSELRNAETPQEVSAVVRAHEGELG